MGGGVGLSWGSGGGVSWDERCDCCEGERVRCGGGMELVCGCTGCSGGVILGVGEPLGVAICGFAQ